MILSNTAIVDALRTGRLKISPAPALDPLARPPFNTSAIDLRLGNEVSVPVDGPRPFLVDLTKGKFADLYNDSNFTVLTGNLIISKHTIRGFCQSYRKTRTCLNG